MGGRWKFLVVRFQVLMTVGMKMAVFCVVVSDISEMFAASIIRAMLQAASTSEMLVNFYQSVNQYYESLNKVIMGMTIYIHGRRI